MHGSFQKQDDTLVYKIYKKLLREFRGYWGENLGDDFWQDLRIEGALNKCFLSCSAICPGKSEFGR